MQAGIMLIRGNYIGMFFLVYFISCSKCLIRGGLVIIGSFERIGLRLLFFGFFFVMINFGFAISIGSGIAFVC